MDYGSMTREQLLEALEEMSMLNRQLLLEKEQETKLDFAWAGNLGHWYWNLKTNTVTFNPLKVTTLGYTVSELPPRVSYQFFTERLHPDDYQRTMDAMTNHLSGKASVYEVEYRIRAKDGNYRWYYDRGKVTQTGANGKPALLAGIVFDITDKKEMQLELESKNKLLAEQSATDGLTKVKNHRALLEYLKSEIDFATESGEVLSAALFDLDDFKMVNDTKGHLFGDKVLMDVAQMMLGCVRGSDLVGRYGGEEFMVVLPGTNAAVAGVVAERIRRAVEKHRFPDGVHVTVSGGIKQYEGENMAEFIRLVDENLYKAKGQGKNRVI